MIRIKPSSMHFSNSTAICKQFSKLIPPGNPIVLVNEDINVDYYLILNLPRPGERFVPSKTIVCHMEPDITTDKKYGIWNNPKKYYPTLITVWDHPTELNLVEWHLSKNWQWLATNPIKKTKVFSSIMSNAYTFTGHKLRLDFLKYIDANYDIDIYGTNIGYKKYKQKLPPHTKDNGLFPYKYTFAAENNAIHNYCTEKLYDAIMSETLCFYWGCPNIVDYLPSESFIWIDLVNNSKEQNLAIIKNAIENNEWEKRLPFIREAKRRLMYELNTFNRLEKFINGLVGGNN